MSPTGLRAAVDRVRARTAPPAAGTGSRTTTGPDLGGAALAAAGAVAHLAAVWLLGRWPPGLWPEGLFETVPAVLAVVAAVVLAARGDRRPLVVAAFYAWAAVAFTLPAYLLGLAFVPGAVLMSLPFRRPPG